MWTKLACGSALLLILAACSSGGTNDTTTSTGGSGGTTTGGTTGDGGTGGQNFLAVALRVNNPNGRSVYLGAYPEMPTGTLDTSKMLQFGNDDFLFGNGNAYVWDRTAQTFTQYQVDNTGALSQSGSVLSLANFGIQNQQESVVFSSSQILSFNAVPANPQIFLTDWNPGTMTLNQTPIQESALAGPQQSDGGYTYANFFVLGPVEFGKYMAFSLSYYNKNGSGTWPHLGVGLIDSTNPTQPAQIITDDRCLGASQVFVDTAGDLYVVGTSDVGLYQLFPTEPPTVPDACVLRIKAGTTTFDPSYNVDLLTATNTRAIWNAFYVGGGKMLALGLKSSYTPTTVSDYANAYGAAELFDPYLVDLAAGTSAPISGLPITGNFNLSEYYVGGKLYYQNYNTASTSTTPANVTVYGVNPDGSVNTYFTASGDIWGMGQMHSH